MGVHVSSARISGRPHKTGGRVHEMTNDASPAIYAICNALQLFVAHCRRHWVKRIVVFFYTITTLSVKSIMNSKNIFCL